MIKLGKSDYCGWEELDEMLELDSKTHRKEMLEGYLSILELKNIVNSETKVDSIKEFLREEFNVEYTLEEIEDQYLIEEEV